VVRTPIPMLAPPDHGDAILKTLLPTRGKKVLLHLVCRPQHRFLLLSFPLRNNPNPLCCITWQKPLRSEKNIGRAREGLNYFLQGYINLSPTRHTRLICNLIISGLATLGFISVSNIRKVLVKWLNN